MSSPGAGPYEPRAQFSKRSPLAETVTSKWRLVPGVMTAPGIWHDSAVGRNRSARPFRAVGGDGLDLDRRAAGDQRGGIVDPHRTGGGSRADIDDGDAAGDRSRHRQRAIAHLGDAQGRLAAIGMTEAFLGAGLVVGEVVLTGDWPSPRRSSRPCPTDSRPASPP